MEQSQLDLIQKSIADATRVYVESLSCVNLDTQKSVLAEWLQWIENYKKVLSNDENLTSLLKQVDSLIYKIEAKKLLLSYSDNFSNLAYENLVKFVAKTIPNIESKGYHNAEQLLKYVQSFAQDVNSFVEQARDILCSAEDNVGNILLIEVGSIDSVIQKLEILTNDIALQMEEVQPQKFTTTTNNMVLPQIKQKLLSAINEDIQRYKHKKEEIEKAIPLAFIEQKLKPFRKIEIDEECDLLKIDVRRNNVCNCFILYTPFAKEAEFLISKIAKKEQLDLFTLDARNLTQKDAQGLDDVCDVLLKKNQHLVVLNANELINRTGTLDKLLKALMRFGQRKGNSFLIDERGEHGLIERAYELARNDSSFKARDITDIYLTMPAYNEVIGWLEKDKELISGNDYQKVRENLPFVGFFGLHNIAKYYQKKEQIWEYARNLDKQNRPLAKMYLQKMVSQIQLLDSGWGDFSSLVNSKNIRKKAEIDYDDITVVNRNNVRKIVESNHSIFAKCGAVTMYCMTAGEDKSIWENIPVEEKSSRLELATKMVYKILGIHIVPEVEVIPLDEWTHKGAGGVCIGGGTQIIYREDCVSGYDWTMDAVCHESFHAFQHQLERCGWYKELFTELGITEGRIEQWIYNFKGYVDISQNKHTYMIQIVESDARAFAQDCYNHGNQVLETLDLE